MAKLFTGYNTRIPGSIATLYKKAFRQRFRDASILQFITHTDPTYKFSKKGDKLVVPILPKIVTHKTKPGEGVQYQKAEGSSETFTIGRERYWALSFEQEQSLFESFDTKNPILNEAALQMTEDVEQEFIDDVIGKVHKDNTGNEAGHKSHAFDVGDTGYTGSDFNSVKLYKTQKECDDSTQKHKEVAADYVVNCIDMLREQPGTKGRDMFVVVPTIVGNKIHTSELKLAGWMNEAKSTLREDIDLLGNLGGASIIVSDKIGFATETAGTTTEKVYPIFFGSRTANVFTEEAVFRDSAMKRTEDWDEYHRAKMVYDWYTVFPEFVGVGYVRV